MKYAKLKDNIVIQIQPNKERGFVEVPDDVICGMIKTADGFIIPEVVKTIEEIQQEIINKVQTIIDDTAKARGYDDMNSVAKYLRPSSPFYSEAVALLDWTDSVWVKLYEIQANIGTTIPTIDEILVQLPEFREV